MDRYAAHRAWETQRILVRFPPLPQPILFADALPANLTERTHETSAANQEPGSTMPMLLTALEAATNSGRRAKRSMVERGSLPGVVRFAKRLNALTDEQVQKLKPHAAPERLVRI